MSQHPSFRQQGGGIFNKRSVLKRFERIELLRRRGQWDEARTRVTGLPKTLPDA